MKKLLIAAVLAFSLNATVTQADVIDAGLRGLRISQVVFHPTKAGTFWVATDNGLFKTTNYGSSWVRSDNGISGSYFGQEANTGKLVISPSNPDTLYVGIDKLYRSTDGGSNWKVMENWNVLSGSNSHVSALAISPSDPNSIYLATMGTKNAYGSTDGGVSFYRMNDPSTYTYNFTVAQSNPDVIYAGTYYGIERSDDRGVTWRWINETEAPTVSGLSESLRVNPCNAQTVYSTHEEGPFKQPYQPDHHSLMATYNGGSSWSYVDTFPSEWSASIATVPGQSDLFYQWDYQTGLMRSDDGGLTWSEYDDSTEWNNSGYNHRVFVDPTDERRVAVATEDGLKIFSSTNYERATPDCSVGIEKLSTPEPLATEEEETTPSTTDTDSEEPTETEDEEEISDVIVLSRLSKPRKLNGTAHSLGVKLKARKKATVKFKITTTVNGKVVTVATSAKSYKKGRYKVWVKLTKTGRKIVNELVKNNEDKKFKITGSYRKHRDSLSVQLKKNALHS